MPIVLSLLFAIRAAEQDLAPWKIKGIEAALTDANPRVRSEALNKLGALKSAATIPLISDQLKDQDRSVRVSALRALGAVGAAAQSEKQKIADLLQIPDEGLRSEAIRALGAIGRAAAEYAPRIAGLMNADPAIRLEALTALGAMGAAEQSTASAVAALRNDPDDSVRAATAVAQCKMEASAHDPVFCIAALINSSDMPVRLMAITALGEMGGAALGQAPALAALAGDPRIDSGLRASAIESLGEMRASSYAQLISNILKSRNPEDEFLREAASKALAAMGDKDSIRDIADLLRGENPSARAEAVRALLKLRDAAGPHLQFIRDIESDPRATDAAPLAECAVTLDAKTCVPKVLQLWKDANLAPSIRVVATEVLEAMGPRDFGEVLNLLAPAYETNELIPQSRFQAHFLGEGKEEPEIALRWLGRSGYKPPPVLPRQEAVRTLLTFLKIWELPSLSTDLREDLAEKIQDVCQRGEWSRNDLEWLEKAAAALRQFKFDKQANTLGDRIQILKAGSPILSRMMEGAGWGLLAHILFWIALIWRYPKSPRVQAIFFWNPWVRRIAGLFYVEFLLTWIPYLRAKLFAPFKQPLLSDAFLGNLDSENYFAELEVSNNLQPQQSPRRIEEAIPEIKQQIVLEGESGLGKTMFLRRLVKNSKRIVVYLPAGKCGKGVIEAIQAKLLGPAGDPDFLRSLIHSGAMDICIDGLNEVSAETRARVIEFAENLFHGNIIIATQPLRWKPRATVYTLQRLRRDKIEAFLCSYKQNGASVSGEAYAQACRDYLAEALGEHQLRADREAAEKILSNPMDLTVAAALLSRGEKPDLFHLIEQQYRVMAADYKRTTRACFPEIPFSECVYQMQLGDKLNLPATDFLLELQCMEEHKMAGALRAQGQTGAIEGWRFRHDKIKEYFIAKTFLGPGNPRPGEHLHDPRFHGVYLLLANLLPLDAAMALREMLIQDAVDSKDNTLSDQFILTLRSREKRHDREQKETKDRDLATQVSEE